MSIALYLKYSFFLAPLFLISLFYSRSDNDIFLAPFWSISAIALSMSPGFASIPLIASSKRNVSKPYFSASKTVLFTQYSVARPPTKTLFIPAFLSSSLKPVPSKPE